jgi:hypothetical protein
VPQISFIPVRAGSPVPLRSRSFPIIPFPFDHLAVGFDVLCSYSCSCHGSLGLRYLCYLCYAYWITSLHFYLHLHLHFHLSLPLNSHTLSHSSLSLSHTHTHTLSLSISLSISLSLLSLPPPLSTFQEKQDRYRSLTLTTTFPASLTYPPSAPLSQLQIPISSPVRDFSTSHSNPPRRCSAILSPTPPQIQLQ